jgi:hypothetical protein
MRPVKKSFSAQERLNKEIEDKSVLPVDTRPNGRPRRRWQRLVRGQESQRQLQEACKNVECSDLTPKRGFGFDPKTWI